MREIKKDDFFFCYTKIMSDFLKGKGIKYIFKAKSIQDGSVFTLYQKSDELQKALDEFKSK